MQLNLNPSSNHSVITIGGNTGMKKLIAFMNRISLPSAILFLKLILQQMSSYSGVLKICCQFVASIQISIRVFLVKLFIG